jgi:hypothetical protein
MTEIVLLAVTRMLSGVCIGGVPRGGGPWIRPVKEFGSLQLGDIRYANGALMRPFDIVSLNLQKPRPAPPHVEDVLCDFVRPRPVWRGRLPKAGREALLQFCLDSHPAEVWCAAGSAHPPPHSLALFEPRALTAAFAFDSYSEKYECRIGWAGYDRPQGAPVTDLKWRALGRQWVTEGPHHQQYDRDSLRRRLGFERLFLAIGLSRNYQGQYWPMVVGVHTLPDYEATVDERRL